MMAAIATEDRRCGGYWDTTGLRKPLREPL